MRSSSSGDLVVFFSLTIHFSAINMANQVITATELQVLEVNSYIRGYHVYVDIWAPTVGESLLVKPEPTNPNNKKAVAVLKDATIVGHVPKNLAPRLFLFLRRDVNKAFAEVTGERSQQRSRLWPGSSVHLLFIRPSSLYRQNETTS